MSARAGGETVPTMNAENPDGMHELHSRISGGMQVRLLWSQDDDRVAVAVAVDDITTGDAFMVEVNDGERALDVFQHPYAYAALRGVPTRPALPVPAGSFEPGRQSS